MPCQGNPIPCPVCGERLPRIADKIQQNLRNTHGLTATPPELHRLAAPKYLASKDKPQVGPDADGLRRARRRIRDEQEASLILLDGHAGTGPAPAN